MFQNVRDAKRSVNLNNNGDSCFIKFFANVNFTSAKGAKVMELCMNFELQIGNFAKLNF